VRKHCHWQYHSCRNRHCSTCGARAKDAWLQARLNQVLEVPCTHRTAIGNERILSLQGDDVVISARAKRREGQAGEQGKKRTLRLRGPDFMGRFVQHVLPSGLKRIRHYGLLANPNGTKLAQARAALHMPAPNPKAQACAQDFMARVARVNIQQCPVCQQGRLGVVQTLARAKHLPDPFEGSTRKANSRAPPAHGP